MWFFMLFGEVVVPRAIIINLWRSLYSMATRHRHVLYYLWIVDCRWCIELEGTKGGLNACDQLANANLTLPFDWVIINKTQFALISQMDWDKQQPEIQPEMQRHRQRQRKRRWRWIVCSFTVCADGADIVMCFNRIARATDKLNR